jgi:phage N-6-adenine-methyltransferase
MANLNCGSLSIHLKAAAPRCAGGPLRGCLSSPRCTINPDGCRRRTTTPVLRYLTRTLWVVLLERLLPWTARSRSIRPGRRCKTTNQFSTINAPDVDSAISRRTARCRQEVCVLFGYDLSAVGDDRASLKLLLAALDASELALKRHMIRGEGRKGDWAIYGALGHIYRDGAGYLHCVVADDERHQSARRWTNVKGRLAAICRLTQDGEDKGCLHLDRLPQSHEAVVIREALGIRKRRIVTDEARLHLEAAPEAANRSSNRLLGRLNDPASTPIARRAAYDVHFSSATDLWLTPQEFFYSCDKIFRFAVDVCAPADYARCAKYFAPEDDGLKREWTGTCWCNPPYGRGIGKWMRKAWESGKAGATVVCLVPARVFTRWWRDNATKGHVRFLRGRLKLGDAESSASFPSTLVTFGARKRHMKLCVVCDNPFAAERSHAETSCGACRVRLHRQGRAA